MMLDVAVRLAGILPAADEAGLLAANVELLLVPVLLLLAAPLLPLLLSTTSTEEEVSPEAARRTISLSASAISSRGAAWPTLASCEQQARGEQRGEGENTREQPERKHNPVKAGELSSPIELFPPFPPQRLTMERASWSARMLRVSAATASEGAVSSPPSPPEEPMEVIGMMTSKLETLPSSRPEGSSSLRRRSDRSGACCCACC